MPPLYKEGVYWLILLGGNSRSLCDSGDLHRADSQRRGRFGLLGFAGLQPLLYRKRRQAVVWDERDTLINYRAVIAGYSVFWLAFTLGVMGLWAVVYFYGGRSTISVHVLPNIVMGGFIVVMTARAIAIVVQYRLQDADKGE